MGEPQFRQKQKKNTHFFMLSSYRISGNYASTDYSEFIAKTEQLATSIDQFRVIFTEKLSALEQKVDQLQTQQHLQTQAQQNIHQLCGPQCVATPPKVPQPPSFEKCRLEFSGLLDQGCVKKEFPAFHVFLMEGTTMRQQTGGDLFIEVAILSAQQEPLIDIVDCTSLRFPLVHGQATIAGMKFMQSSYAYGRHFFLELTLCSAKGPITCVPKVRSLPIRVTTKTNRKQSVSSLCGDDDISRIAGLGGVYVDKLRLLNIHTVRDLASVDLAPENFQTVVQCVRKARGIMTEQKLLEMVQSARAACGYSVSSSPSSPVTSIQDTPKSSSSSIPQSVVGVVPLQSVAMETPPSFAKRTFEDTLVELDLDDLAIPFSKRARHEPGVVCLDSDDDFLFSLVSAGRSSSC